jgi:hypothetical protein
MLIPHRFGYPFALCAGQWTERHALRDTLTLVVCRPRSRARPIHGPVQPQLRRWLLRAEAKYVPSRDMLKDAV